MATESLADKIRSIWLRRLELVYRWIPDILDDRDIEPLHQLRVSIRYLLSLENAFRMSDSVPLVKEICSSFQKVLKQAGLVRDLDVQIQTLERWRISNPVLSPAVFNRYTAHLNARRQPLFDRLCLMLVDVPSLSTWKSRLTSDGDRPIAPFITSSRWLSFFQKRKTRIQKGLERLEHKTNAEEQINILHKIRIALKSIRYPVAVLNEYLEGRLDATIVRFKQIQDLLGGLHDNEVMIQSLVEYQRTVPTVSGEKDDINALLEECERIRYWHLDRFSRDWGQTSLLQFLEDVLAELRVVIPKSGSPRAII